MISQIYSVFDKVTGVYLPPFCASNSDDAKRQMMSMFINQKNQITTFPDNYTLNSIGAFNDGTAKLEDSVSEVICEMKTIANQVLEKIENARPETESSSIF